MILCSLCHSLQMRKDIHYFFRIKRRGFRQTDLAYLYTFVQVSIPRRTMNMLN